MGSGTFSETGVFDRLAAIPVDACLGLEPVAMPENGARLRMPIPRGDALADQVGGAVAVSVLADAVGGWAMAHVQGAGLSGPTIELRVDHAGPPAEHAGWLIGAARLRYLAEDAGYLAIEITDDTGRPVADARGHYVMLPPDADPYEQPVQVDGAVYDRPDVLFAALAVGGADPVGWPDPAEWAVPAVAQLSNPRGQVHGGVLMAIGQLAQRRLQQADLAEPAALRPLSVQVEYLRPAKADGGELSCRSTYVRRGRRFRTVRTELSRPDGRVAAVATGLWSSTT